MEQTIEPSANEEAAAPQLASFESIRCVTDLLEKLADRKRHVSFLIGSGCSKAVGLPDTTELANKVGEALASNQDQEKTYRSLLQDRNIEQVLTRIRTIADVLDDQSQTVDGLTGEAAREMDRVITRAIHQSVSIQPTTLDHHRSFAGFLGRANHDLPIEVFTINYDLLLEQGFETAGVPYFDGFVGSIEGTFRPDLVDTNWDSMAPPDSLQLPPGWVRLWKLHGSVSWRLKPNDRKVVRIASVDTAAADEALAIYPSRQKYEESRRVPFVTLFDRFRKALETPESITITCGYSFGDEHINEVLFDATERLPRSEVVALFRSKMPETVCNKAKNIPNFTAIDASRLILGTTEYYWVSAPEGFDWLWESGGFSLGDFKIFVRVLAGSKGMNTSGMAGTS